MFSFPNLARPDKKIPFYQFKVVRSEMNCTTKFLLITGIVAAILGGLALYGTQLGTITFYLSLCELSLATSIVAGALFFHYGAIHYKTLSLPRARSFDKYLHLLDINQKNQYSYYIPDLLKHHFERKTANLEEQTLLDLDGDTIFLLNGYPIPLERTDFTEERIYELACQASDPILLRKEVEKLNPEQVENIHLQYIRCRKQAFQNSEIPSLIRQLLNQALYSEMLGILMGRYNNDALNIMLTQRQGKNVPTSNTLIDYFRIGEKPYVRLGQILQFTSNGEALPYYMKAELLIDVDSGEGKLTWSSPQTNQPTLT